MSVGIGWRITGALGCGLRGCRGSGVNKYRFQSTMAVSHVYDLLNFLQQSVHSFFDTLPLNFLPQLVQCPNVVSDCWLEILRVPVARFVG